MRKLPGALVAMAFAVVSAATFASMPTDAVPHRAVKTLDLDRLYSLPWLIGTQPEGPQWAPDSQRLAFLWNDDGTNFRDVWMTDVRSGKPLRITAMPRLPVPSDPGKDVAKLRELERAEKDRGVSSVVWASDGRTLVFAFHGRLYGVAPGHEPLALTDTDEAASEPIASPRANRIAYLCGADLCVLDLASRTPAKSKIYATGIPGVTVESFSWAPDGRRLSFVETDIRNIHERGIPDYLADETRLVPVRRAFPGEPSETHRVGLVAVSGGPVHWAELGGDPMDQLFGVSWSPDSNHLLIDKSDLYIKDRQLLVIDATSGTSRELLREVNPANVTAEWWSDWAPDGNGVYFISDRDEDYHIYYAPLSGGPVARITQGDWAVFSAGISPRARSLVFVSNQGRPEERQVYQVPFGGGIPVRLSSGAGNHAPTISPDGRWLADLYSNDTTPQDLYLSDIRAATQSHPRQVTHSPLPEFGDYRWVAAKYVEFHNVNDGTLLHARLTLPPDFDPTKKYPAILGSTYSNTVHNRWGGRIYHPTWALDQYLAQQGYVIMNVDISGSSGHGKAFRQRIREDYGGVDVEDLYSGVRFLVHEGFVDEGRVGIWGSSYGGLLTTMSLFKRPGVYKSGVAGAPATSLFHAETGEMRTMLAPQDHQQQYARSSAFLQSGGLRDHLMIIHGMKDDTVLFKDSITLTERLILQGGDVELVTLPDAPHGWDTEGLAQTRFAFHKLVEHFRRYLGEGPTR